MNARHAVTVGISGVLACAAVIGAGAVPGGAVAPNLTGTWTATGLPAVSGQPVALAYDSTHGQLFAVLSFQKGRQFRFLQGGGWQFAPDPFQGIGLDQPTLVDAPAMGGLVATQDNCAARWNGTSWSAVSCLQPGPDQLIPVAAAYDGTRGTLLAVVDDYYTNCCVTAYGGARTFSWNGQGWQELTSVPARGPVPDMIPTVTVGCPDIESCAAVNFEPFELTTSAATWDAARHRVVLVRGGTHTWTWDGARWSTFVAPTPTGTDSVSLAYDPALATDLVYGYPYRTGVWSDTVWKPVVTKGLQPIAGPIADDPQLGGVLLMANPIGVHAQPALIWRFTPGIAAP